MAVGYYFSKQSAQELAEIVHEARKSEREFLLEIIIMTSEGVEELNITVKESCEAQIKSTGEDIVHCRNKEGRNITIHFPPPHERPSSQAEILIGGDPATK